MSPMPAPGLHLVLIMGLQGSSAPPGLLGLSGEGLEGTVLGM